MMDVAATLRDDWRFIDDPRTVILTCPAHYLSPSSVSYEVESVAREEATQQDAVTAGVNLDGTSCAFHLWAAKLPQGVVPGKGWTLRDGSDDVLYEVKQVQRHDEGMRYRCVCQRRQEA
jgi:hypothetical protein